MKKPTSPAQLVLTAIVFIASFAFGYWAVTTFLFPKR